MSDAAIVKAPEKSWVQSVVERMKGSIERAPTGSPTSYVKQAGSTLVDFASGGTVGALLGAAHGKFGLDTKGGPIDGWLSGIGAIASIGLSAHFPRMAELARTAGSQAFAVLSFRKSYGVVKHEPLPGGTGPAIQRVNVPSKGSIAAGEDPIEKAAKALG